MIFVAQYKDTTYPIILISSLKRNTQIFRLSNFDIFKWEIKASDEVVSISAANMQKQKEEEEEEDSHGLMIDDSPLASSIKAQ